MVKYEYNADYCIGQHPTEHALTNKTTLSSLARNRFCVTENAVYRYEAMDQIYHCGFYTFSFAQIVGFL